MKDLLNKLDNLHSKTMPGEWYVAESDSYGSLYIRSFEDGDNNILDEDGTPDDFYFLVEVQKNWSTISRMAKLGISVQDEAKRLSQLFLSHDETLRGDI